MYVKEALSDNGCCGYSRRQFIRAALAGAGVLATGAPSLAAAQMMKRKTVLYIP